MNCPKSPGTCLEKAIDHHFSAQRDAWEKVDAKYRTLFFSSSPLGLDLLDKKQDVALEEAKPARVQIVFPKQFMTLLKQVGQGTSTNRNNRRGAWLRTKGIGTIPPPPLPL